MRSKRLSAWVLTISLFFGSCDLFKTRDPISPESSSSVLPTATDDETLLENFSLALTQSNPTEYQNLFADEGSDSRTFVFIPAQAPAVRYASVFALWDKTAEYNYFNKIISEIGTSPIQVSIITESASTIRYQDSVITIVDYTLVVPHKHANLTTQFSGKSELHMAVNKTGVWRIYQWTDYETKQDSSWSELKGQFFQ